MGSLRSLHLLQRNLVMYLYQKGNLKPNLKILRILMLRLMGNTFPRNKFFFFKFPSIPSISPPPPTSHDNSRLIREAETSFLLHISRFSGEMVTHSQLRDLISLVNPGSTSGFPSGRIPKPSTRMYPGGITCGLPPKNQHFPTLIDNIRKKKTYVTVESIFIYLLHFL